MRIIINMGGEKRIREMAEDEQYVLSTRSLNASQSEGVLSSFALSTVDMNDRIIIILLNNFL
jgi:hypothetical protein